MNEVFYMLLDMLCDNDRKPFTEWVNSAYGSSPTNEDADDLMAIFEQATDPQHYGLPYGTFSQRQIYYILQSN